MAKEVEFEHISFVLSAPLAARLDALKDEFAGASRSQLIRLAVKEFVERHGDDAKG